MILGSAWILAMIAVWHGVNRPSPTPAEFAKARLLEVVASDREAAPCWSWRPQFRADLYALGEVARRTKPMSKKRARSPYMFARKRLPVYRWERR